MPSAASHHCTNPYRSHGHEPPTTAAGKHRVIYQGWVTVEQLGGPRLLNSMVHAKAIVEAGELPARPHESAALAALGVRQYFWTSSVTTRSAGVKQEAGTSITTELKPDEYAEVTEDVARAAGKPVKRKAPPKEKVELSQEELDLKAAVAARGTMLRKLKVLLDRAATEADNSPCVKLAEKGYPEAMVEFWSSKVVAFKAEVTLVQQLYVREATKVACKATSLASVADATLELDGAVQQLDKTLKAFKAGPARQIARLA